MRCLLRYLLVACFDLVECGLLWCCVACDVCAFAYSFITFIFYYYYFGFAGLVFAVYFVWGGLLDSIFVCLQCYRVSFVNFT